MYKHHRYPRVIIQHAVYIKLRFTLSYRDVEELMALRGVKVEHSTLQFSLFSELERDLISLRIKEALAVKKSKGIKLGKPKGTIQKSMYDKDLDKIKEWLDLGLSGRKISKNLDYGSYISLNPYLNKRKLKNF